jgi:hypothetical protein
MDLITSITTKEELIEALNQLPAGAKIRIAVDTHDHWRTELAVESTLDLDAVYVQHTAYHSKDQILDEDKIEYQSNGQHLYASQPVQMVYVLRPGNQ